MIPYENVHCGVYLNVVIWITSSKILSDSFVFLIEGLACILEVVNNATILIVKAELEKASSLCV